MRWFGAKEYKLDRLAASPIDRRPVSQIGYCCFFRVERMESNRQRSVFNQHDQYLMLWISIQ
jgi:hypothetical protein